MAYHRFHGVDTRIVRIFNTYGPRMRLNDGRVVPPSSRQALRDEPLTVFGDGKPDPLASATSPTSSKASTACCMSDEVEPVNIGNPEEMTILQFAEEITRLTGSHSAIDYRPLPRTIRRCAGPTSPRRARCSAGSQSSPGPGTDADDRLFPGRWLRNRERSDRGQVYSFQSPRHPFCHAIHADRVGRLETVNPTPRPIIMTSGSGLQTSSREPYVADSFPSTENCRPDPSTLTLGNVRWTA